MLVVTERSLEKERIRQRYAKQYQYFTLVIVRNTAWLLYAVFFLIMVTGRFAWAYPAVDLMMKKGNMIGFLTLFAGFILALIKPWRIVGGMTLQLSGLLFLCTTHCSTALITYALGGTGWLVAGTLAAGYGVIPVAIVLALQKDSEASINFLFLLAQALVALISGTIILRKCSQDANGAKLQ